MPSSIQIYTTGYCPYCIRAKELLARKGIKFEEINLDGNLEELNALKNRTGHRTVPQIFIDGKMIGGFSELAGMDSRGELEGLK